MSSDSSGLAERFDRDWHCLDAGLLRREQLEASRLPAQITRAASKQTYYTIRFLADRDRVADAYRTYAYFRWVDDRLDEELSSQTERIQFIERQQAVMNRCYRGEQTHDLSTEESMLADLISIDTESDSGLQAYIRHMMAVMVFDAARRGRLISGAELDGYTCHLAAAVTEAMHYFIGHGQYAPTTRARYCAVSGAHITHLLRDTFDDIRAGYFNVAREFLDEHHISAGDVGSSAYRLWVRNRVQQARHCFDAGKDYLRQVENRRCRIAGYAYMLRFQGVLDAITREGYQLRPHYSERTNLRGKLGILSGIFSLLLEDGMGVTESWYHQP